MASRTYPTNQVLAVIDEPAAAERAVAALVASGFAAGDVIRMTARDRPSKPGRWTRLVRIFQFMSMDQGPDFHIYEAAMREGRAVVAGLRGNGATRALPLHPGNGAAGCCAWCT